MAEPAAAVGGGGQREVLDEEVPASNADFEQRSANFGLLAWCGFSFGRSLDSALKSALGRLPKFLEVTSSSFSRLTSLLRCDLQDEGPVVSLDLFEVSIQRGHADAVGALLRRGEVRSRFGRGRRHGRCLALARHAGAYAAPWLLMVPACLACTFTQALALMLAVLPALSAICMAVTSMTNTGDAP